MLLHQIVSQGNQPGAVFPERDETSSPDLERVGDAGQACRGEHTCNGSRTRHGQRLEIIDGHGDALRDLPMFSRPGIGAI
jgi:hypothetical protein